MKITSTTSTTVSPSVRLTSCRASRIDSERSLVGVRRMEAGSWVSKRGSIALTRSTTSTVLASGWRCTASVIDGSPLKLAKVLAVSTLSCTSATSRSRIGAPLRVATIRLPNSRALASWRLATMVSVWRGPSSVPTGELALAPDRAARSSSSVRPRWASVSGLTRMRTANRFWPKIDTCATPLMVDRLGAIRFSANSFRSDIDIDGEVMASSSTGASAGLTLR